MKKQKRNQNLIVIIISILIVLFVYFLINIIRFFRQPADTVLIKNGEVIKYEEVVGYLIRDEHIIDTSTYEGTPIANVDDAARVAKGTEIITYISKEEEQINQKIAELDVKIQDAMETKQTIFSNDAKALDSEIEIYLYSTIKENKDVYSILENKDLINEKIEKKAKIVGDLSPVGSKLNTLIEERTSYEKQLNDSEKTIKASKAGLVSYRVDNYEDIFTLSSISKLTIDELEKIKLSANQTIPINTSNAKIVNNFECYIAVPMYSDESKNAKLNDSVYLRFDNTGDELINATVEYISEEENGRLLVFKIKRNVEELTKYRKIDFDVVWWQAEGLKINKDAVKVVEYPEIKDESGDSLKMSIITTKRSSYTENAFAKIVKEAGDFVIVENYEDEELIELGFTEEMVSDRATLKMYDEAIIVEN